MKRIVLIMCLLLNLPFVKAQDSILIKNRTDFLRRWSPLEVDNLFDKHITPHHYFYQFVPVNEESYKIVWGNDSIRNTSKSIFTEREGVRHSLAWENDDFIVIHGSDGSDTWHNIILPLKSNANECIVFNPIAKDMPSNIIVLEQCGTSDTLLAVYYLKTQTVSYIVDPQIKCSSFFIHYCIKSIKFSNNQLVVEWVTPNYIDTPNTIIRKEYKLYAR